MHTDTDINLKTVIILAQKHSPMSVLKFHSVGLYILSCFSVHIVQATNPSKPNSAPLTERH